MVDDDVWQWMMMGDGGRGRMMIYDDEWWRMVFYAVGLRLAIVYVMNVYI